MSRRSLPGPRSALLALLLLAVLTPPAAARPLVPGSPPPPDEARARLARAAADAALQPWQRDFMRDLAGEDGAAPALAERSADAVNDTWGELILDSRLSHGAVHDPVRDCLVAFGGVDSSNRHLDDLIRDGQIQQRGRNVFYAMESDRRSFKVGE